MAGARLRPSLGTSGCCTPLLLLLLLVASPASCPPYLLLRRRACCYHAAGAPALRIQSPPARSAGPARLLTRPPAWLAISPCPGPGRPPCRSTSRTLWPVCGSTSTSSRPARCARGSIRSGSPHACAASCTNCCRVRAEAASAAGLQRRAPAAAWPRAWASVPARVPDMCAFGAVINQPPPPLRPALRCPQVNQCRFRPWGAPSRPARAPHTVRRLGQGRAAQLGS